MYYISLNFLWMAVFKKVSKPIPYFPSLPLPFQQKVRPWPSEKKVSCHLHPSGDTNGPAMRCVGNCRCSWIMCPAMTWTKQQKRFAKKKVSTGHGSWTLPPEKDIKKNKPLPNLLFLRGSMLSTLAMSVHRLTIDTWQMFESNFLASPRLPQKILEQILWFT